MRHDNFSIAEFSYIPELPKRIHDYGLWLFNSHCPTPQLIRNTSPLRNTFEHCPIRRFHYYSISHLLAGKGRVWLENGMQRIVNPGDCIITLDGMLNRYGAIEGEPYVEDNLCFKGPVADMMRKSGLLQSGVFHLGQIRRLKPIHELLLLLTVDSHLAAAMKLQHLLGEIYFSRQPRKTGKTDAFDMLLETIREYPEKWWTIPELAEICGLSPTHLRRLFIEKTGYPPKRYIDRLKLQMIGERLRTTSKSAAQLAQEFGYLDPFHFYRRFKEVMGMSPKQFRTHG